MNLVDTPIYYAGGGFPWGLLIIGAILFVLWQKGWFGGPGRNDGGFGPRGFDGGYGGARERFEQWHREAHAVPAQPGSPAATAPETASQPVTPTTPPAAPQTPPRDGETASRDAAGERGTAV